MIDSVRFLALVFDAKLGPGKLTFCSRKSIFCQIFESRKVATYLKKVAQCRNMGCAESQYESRIIKNFKPFQ